MGSNCISQTNQEWEFWTDTINHMIVTIITDVQLHVQL